MGPDEADRLAALEREIREREAEIAGLSDRLEARAARLRTLARVNQLVSSALDMDDVLREIASAAVRLMDAPFASFWLADEDAQTLELGAWVGDPTITEAPISKVKFDEGIVGWVARRRRPLVVPDASQRLVASEWAKAHGLRSVFAVPVIGEGKLLAVLALIARVPFSAEAEDENLVEIFAAQAAAAIRNARLFAESEARRRAAEALADVGAVLAQTLDPEVVGQRVADSLRRLLGAHSAVLFRLEPGTGNLVTMAISGAADGGWSRNLTFPRGSGATGLAIEERRPISSPNVLTDLRLVLSAEFRARIEASQHRAVLAIPLVIKDQVIGALSVGDRAGRAFRPEEVQLAQAFADQAALALEGARLFQDAQDRRRVAQALYDLAVAMDRTMEVRERVQIFLGKAQEALDFDRVGVFLATPDHELEMIAGTNLDPSTVPAVAFWERGGGFQAVWDGGETVVVSSDAELAALPPAAPEVREHPFSRSRRFVLVPLRFQGRPIGAVGADNKTTRRPFSARAVARLELFCQQLAISLSTARVFAESERRRRAAEALADVGAVLAQTLDPEVVAQRIADDTRDLLRARACAVYRLEPASGNLVAVAIAGSVGPTFGRDVVFPRGVGVAALAVRDGRPVMTSDILNDPQITLTPEVSRRIEQAEYRAVLALPLMVKDTVIGALGIGDGLGRRFRPEDIDLAQALAHQAALALRSADLFQDAQDRRRQTEALYDLALAMERSLDVRERVDIFLEKARESLDLDRIGVFLATADETALELVGCTVPTGGVTMLPFRDHAGPFQLVWETGKRVVVSDDEGLAALPPMPAELKDHPLVRSTRFAIVPLTFKGRPVGVVSADNKTTRRPITARSVEKLELFCQQLSGSVSTARLYAETQRRERESRVLFEAVRRLSTTLDLEQVLDIIADHTLQVLPCDAAGIFRWDDRRGGLAFVRGRNMNMEIAGSVLLKPGEGVAGRAYADRRPVWSNDRLADRALVYSAGTQAILRRGSTHRAYLAVPIVVRKGVFGVLMALHMAPQQYSTRHIDLLTNLAAHGAVAIENASLYAAEARARSAAEAATGAKSRFLAAMSHELRTPLNSVIGFANVLLKNRGQNLREQEMLYLRRILDNGTHLLGLINDILDLSKIEAGRIELAVGPVALDGLIHETILELESQVRERDLRLVAELPPSMTALHTDRSRLKQVLINLIGNALKFTERGSVTVRVTVERDGLRPVRIDVIDTGIGIPREKQAVIFEAFQQSDTSTARRYGGTGLGLAISRSLAQQMGYQLSVASEVGKGSTFSVHLAPTSPRVHRSRDVRTPAPRPPALETPPALDGKVVLVVDDESDSRILLAQVIEDLGCTVLAAASGEEGLRMARARRPDLIALDLLMPGMSGWQTLATIKADADLRDIPVVIVSIIASEHRSGISGPVDFLDKPVTRENLLEVLARHFAPRA